MGTHQHRLKSQVQALHWELVKPHTMTPKEKAIELFDKYATYVVMWSGGIEVEKQNCKQCALIAVDEIINSSPARSPINDGSDAMPHFRAVKYWEQVKQEIEKL